MITRSTHPSSNPPYTTPLTPPAGVTPFDALAHEFFDDLQKEGLKLENGMDLPPLFNFSEDGAVALMESSSSFDFVFFFSG